MSGGPSANGQNYHAVITEGVEDPHPHDVLCGRGGGTNNHIGNNHWRTLVAANKRLYLSLPKRQKMLVAQSIVRAVRSQNPSGRFLQKNSKTKLWDDIGDQKAQDKTSQALREGAPDIRNVMKSEEAQRQEITRMAASAGIAAPGMPMMQPMMPMAPGVAGQQHQLGMAAGLTQQQPFPGMPVGPGSIPSEMMPPMKAGQQSQMPFPSQPGWNQQHQAGGYPEGVSADAAAWKVPPSLQGRQQTLAGGADPSAAIRPASVPSSSQAQQPQRAAPQSAADPSNPSSQQAQGQGHEHVQLKRKLSSSVTDAHSSAAGPSQPAAPGTMDRVPSPEPFVARVASEDQTNGSAARIPTGGSNNLMLPPPLQPGRDPATRPTPHGYGNIMSEITQQIDDDDEEGLEPPKLIARSSMGRRVLPPNARLRFKDNNVGEGSAKTNGDPLSSTYPGRNFPHVGGGAMQQPNPLLDDDDEYNAAALDAIAPVQECEYTQAGVWDNVRNAIEQSSRRSSDATPIGTNVTAAASSAAIDVQPPEFPREASGDPSMSSFARDISMMSNLSAFSTGGLSDMFGEDSSGGDLPAEAGAAPALLRRNSGTPGPVIRGISGVSVGNVDMGNFERGISEALSEMSLSRGPSLATTDFGGAPKPVMGIGVGVGAGAAMGDLLGSDEGGDVNGAFERTRAAMGVRSVTGGLTGSDFSGNARTAGVEGSYGTPGGGTQPPSIANRQVGQVGSRNTDATETGLDDREQLEVTFLSRGQSLAFQHFTPDES